MQTKVVKKSLAAVEDLLLGTKKVQQIRGGKLVEVSAVPVAKPVESVTAMANLDVTVADFALLDGLNYAYSATATSGIKSNTAAGYWVFWPSVANIYKLWQSVVSATGHTLVGSFELGAVVMKPTDVVVDISSATCYKRVNADSITIPPGSQPDAAWAVFEVPGALSGLANVVDRVEALEAKSVANLAALRLITPKDVGEVVYVRAAYDVPAGSAGYFGGGFFASYDNKAANPDDGGVYVNSASPTLAWQRINFASYDMQFWGVLADIDSIDNLDAITRATDFARSKKIVLEAPAGKISTSNAVPLYDNMGIVGRGTQDHGTVFSKTTNLVYNLKANGVTKLSIDALLVCVPKAFAVDGTSEVVRCRLENCAFMREGLTEDNYGSTRPQYGGFFGTIVSSTVKDVLFSGAYVGSLFYQPYLSELVNLRVSNWETKGFQGIVMGRVVGGKYLVSGTSMDLRRVQAWGYQIGFDISSMQYTSLTDCVVELCSPMPGETQAIAYNFVNPYGISMISCASEEVKGTQINVRLANDVSFKASLTVQNYLPISQKNPAVSVPFLSVDSAGVGTVNVTIIGGDLTRNTANTNVSEAVVSGANAKVISIGAGGFTCTATGGGVYTNLA